MTNHRDSINEFGDMDFRQIPVEDQGIINLFRSAVFPKTVFYDDVFPVVGLFELIETVDRIEHITESVSNSYYILWNALLSERPNMSEEQQRTFSDLVEAINDIRLDQNQLYVDSFPSLTGAFAPTLQAINGLIDAAAEPLLEALSDSLQAFRQGKGAFTIAFDNLGSANSTALTDVIKAEVIGANATALVAVDAGQIAEILKDVVDLFGNILEVIQDPTVAGFNDALKGLVTTTSDILAKVKHISDLFDIDTGELDTNSAWFKIYSSVAKLHDSFETWVVVQDAVDAGTLSEKSESLAYAVLGVQLTDALGTLVEGSKETASSMSNLDSKLGELSGAINFLIGAVPNMLSGAVKGEWQQTSEYYHNLNVYDNVGLGGLTNDLADSYLDLLAFADDVFGAPWPVENTDPIEPGTEDTTPPPVYETDPVDPVDPPEPSLPYLTVANVSSATVTEGDAYGETALVFLVKVHGDMNEDISFSVSTYPGNTSNGAGDYLGYSNYPITLSAQNGETERLVYVNLVGDRAPERMESFTFKLDDIVGADVRYASDLTAIGMIEDDDAGLLELNQTSSATVAEEDGRIDYLKIITPNSGDMSIDFSQMPTEVEVRVFDYLGEEYGQELAYQFIEQGQEGRLELPHTAGGLYFVKVTGIIQNPDGYQVLVSSPPSQPELNPIPDTPVLPDLIVSDLQLNGESLTSGDTSVQQFRAGDVIELNARIENDGGGIVGLTSTAIVTSQGLTSQPLQTVTTAVLPSGSSTLLNGNRIEIAEDTAPGTYVIAVKTDFAEKVSEQNDDNNLHRVYVTVAADDASGDLVTDPADQNGYGADVTIENVVLSQTSVEQGGQVTVTYDIVNNGTSTAESGEVDVHSLLSLTANAATEEGEETFKSLVAGERVSETLTFDIGTGQNVGSWHLRLDAGDVDGDIDLSNNVVFANYTVTAPPAPSGISDLSIQNFLVEDYYVDSIRREYDFTEDTILHSGDELYIAWDNVHLGEDIFFKATGDIGFYLSTDANVTTADTLLYSEELDRLWIGDIEDEGHRLDPLSEGLVPGTYYLAAITDIYDQTGETNEYNNRSEVIPITIGAPRIAELAVSDAALAASSINAGEDVELTVTIENTGTLSANNSRFQVWLSEDSVFGNADDIQIDEVLITKILPYGDTSTKTVMIGSDLDAGDYNIFVQSNGDGGISSETNFDNNLAFAGGITVLPPSLPVIAGNVIGDTSEDGVLTTNGSLTAISASGDVSFTPISNLAGTFGVFTIDALGGWTYSLDNTKVQLLSTGQIETDNFDVVAVAANGATATKTVRVSVHGLDEDNLAPVVSVTDQIIDMEDAAGLQLSSIVSIEDPEGDEITLIDLWGNTGGHSWRVDDQVVDASAGFKVDSLDQISIVADISHSVQTLWVRAFDGTNWSEWDSFSLTTYRASESINGTSGDDVIHGTDLGDSIYAHEGNDKVYAGKGSDKVYLGDGDDYVRVGGGVEKFYGGAGKDYISYYDSTGGVTVNLATNEVLGSWASNDTISGFESVSGSKTGADKIYGTSGSNTIKTYGGNDKVYAGSGTDKVYLGDGDDYVRVGGGVEKFYGGAGKDYISYYDSTGGVTVNLATNEVLGSWASNDTISGFESVSGSKTGADKIYGTSGANTIKTYGGDDKVYGGSGSDKIYLGDGNDYVRVGGGTESFYGGAGKDYISYYDSTGGVTVNLATNEVLGSWASNDTISGFESVSGSKTGADKIYGTSGANTIKTYGGDDKVYGGSGSDKIYLGDGNDYVRVGGGTESFYGGDGKDYISYYDSTGGINIDLEADSASGAWAVNDTIQDFESASGSKTGADKMYGTSGSNTLKSYGGDDKLYGRSGDDKLYGGDGQDRFDGGAGTDLLYGGADADVFHFDHGEDHDIIKDFENNIDTIQLDNFTFAAGQDAFDFAEQVGSNVVFDFGGGDMLTVEDATIGQLFNALVIV